MSSCGAWLHRLASGTRCGAQASRYSRRHHGERALHAGLRPQASSATGTAKPSSTETKPRPRILSGVQPTGTLHLGNYLGAIRGWTALQHEYDAFFCVVDLHAVTLPHDPAALQASTRSVAAMYLAAGIDPAVSTVFVQSHVSAHAELTWLLSCATPLGWLRKMIQFKEKSKKTGEEVGTGLLTYPVLMAADILLYQPDLVPVGEDQRQHLELTRDLAERMNSLYGGKRGKKLGLRGSRLFRVPEAGIVDRGGRCMSLLDGTVKMSKSAESDASRINLLDPPDLIRKKVQRAKTDAQDGLRWGDPDRPEAANLLTIYQTITGRPQEEVAEEVAAMRWGTFKPLLAEALVEHLAPIQQRYADIMADPQTLDDILEKGAEAAGAVAHQTLDDVKKAMGFMLPHKSR
ncbi:TSW2 [Auxenochlorella protothecoides x Auxenochlorella symbiontica]